MYNNLFGRDPERSMDCNFLLFFPQFQLCCCAPCHQSDHNIISKDQIVVGESIPGMVAGASTSERWYDYHGNVQKIACRSKFEKLGLFFVLSNVMCWVGLGLVWFGLGLGGFIFLGFVLAAFLWLKCTNGQDCSELLLKYGIATRGGPSFGVSSAFVRLSLLDRDPLFDLLLQRLASIR
jgi:hypothetical protein